MRLALRELARAVAPAPIAAALVLALNDHVLKASPLAGAVTGKLSDIAGLFLLPVLGAAITAVLWRRSRGADAVWCAATAFAFAALKLHPGVNAWAESWWGVNLLDPTDLLALPMTVLAWIYLGREPAPNQVGCVMVSRGFAPGPPPSRVPRGLLDLGQVARVAVVTAAGAVCIATPAPRPPPPMPVAAWAITADAERELGCVLGRAWVSKSGKTGVGITVHLANRSQDECSVLVEKAGFETGGRIVDAMPGTAPKGAILAGCTEQWLYVPFELDNEAAWNSGSRDGTFRLAVATTGESVAWAMPAEHRFVTPPWPGRPAYEERRPRPSPCGGHR